MLIQSENIINVKDFESFHNTFMRSTNTIIFRISKEKANQYIELIEDFFNCNVSDENEDNYLICGRYN